MDFDYTELISKSSFVFTLHAFNFRPLTPTTTAFVSYGSFWISYATILIPGSGIAASFTDEKEFQSSLGIFLIAWFMVTLFML